MKLYLTTPLTQRDLDRVRKLPTRLAQPNRRFLAWRVLCKNDFTQRLTPRPISVVANRIETSYAKARMLCQLHGWACIPRKAATDLQLWAPPIGETFAEIQTDF